MNSGAIKTQNDLIKLQFALPADEWIIQFVPEGGKGSPIRDVISSRRLFREDQVRWFRYQNYRGFHIYGRPKSTKYVLIDLDKGDPAAEIQRMRRDGLLPTVVIETSPGKFHVWLAVSNEELPIPVATALSKILATKYHGDPGSTYCLHPGRLPGLRNKKFDYMEHPGHGGPLVTLRTARMNPVIPDGMGELIAEAEPLAALPASPSSFPQGACVPTTSFASTDIDLSRSRGTRAEAIEVYKVELVDQAERNGWTLPHKDRSEADFYVARGLHLVYHIDPDDIAAILMQSSDKAAERGEDYVVATVRAAISR